MNNSKHYAAAITAFVTWGFFPIALRALQQYSSGDILYFRILFSLLVLAFIIFGFKKSDIKENWKKFSSLDQPGRKLVVVLTLAGGALLTINWLCFIYVVNNINIKTASFAYLICPVITAVLGVFLIREKMTTLQWIAVGLCAFSCALMGINSMVELGYSVLTAFTYALYLITQRKNQGFDRMIMLGVQTLFSFLILSALVTYLVDSIPSASGFYGIILVIAIFFTVIPLFLNLYALNRINAATIGILMYLNPLFNFSVAFLVFHETATSLQILGYFVILIALVIFNYPNFRKVKTAISSLK